MTIALKSLNRGIPGGNGEFATNFTGSSASSGEIIEADPGAGLSIYLDYLLISCAADEVISIREDSTVILGPYTFKVAAPVPLILDFRKGGIVLTANTELQIITSGSSGFAGYLEGRVKAP